ncbi:MAG: PASTA domain-containing protein [Bacilli bacterium]|nr:PASTA domain-containing protein [Bacilli bacterium]
MICSKCDAENEEDAYFCKRCGFPLDEEAKIYDNSPKEKTKRKKIKKIKTKYKDKKQKGKMNLFQKIIMLFFILLSISALALAGYLSYYIYESQNIIVPEVMGYSYEKASIILKDKNLQSEKIEKKVSNPSEVGIVISQNKKAGKKASKNAIIKLTVGVLDDSVIMPKVTNLKLTEAINTLNKNKIKYKVVYSASDEENDTVINQNTKAGSKIKSTDIVIITVSKNEEKKIQNNKTEENQDTDIKTDKNNNTDKQTDDVSN